MTPGVKDPHFPEKWQFVHNSGAHGLTFADVRRRLEQPMVKAAGVEASGDKERKGSRMQMKFGHR